MILHGFCPRQASDACLVQFYCVDVIELGFVGECFPLGMQHLA